MVEPLPTPGVTPGGADSDYLHARMLNAAIDSRYEENRDAIADEETDRETADTDLQTQITDNQNGEQAWADVMFSGGTTAGINNTPVILEGACVVVPPSDTPQLIRYGTPYNLTVTGGGYMTVQLYDYTLGSAQLQDYVQRRIESTHPTTTIGDNIKGIHRMDPHTDYRVMQVYFTLSRDAGSSLQVGVPAVNAIYARQIIEVVKL